MHSEKDPLKVRRDNNSKKDMAFGSATTTQDNNMEGASSRTRPESSQLSAAQHQFLTNSYYNPNFSAKPKNITIIQIYAPTSTYEDDLVE